jgi:bacteriophage N4 adsorption protein B
MPNWTLIDSLSLLLFLLLQILPVLAVLIAISGLDDLFIDCAYVYRRLSRYLSYYRTTPRMTAQMLTHVPLKKIAVMIPAWDESAVISAMLRATTALWPQSEVQFFVGCYPNDMETIERVRAQATRDNRIHLVQVSRQGPTTKAHCLNEIFAFVCRWETSENIIFSAFLLHDAEDLVSAREPAVISHLIDRRDILQFPVRPLVVPGSLWVSGHYLDEFAESHGKDLQVREFLGACLPSAGVGCAFSRRAMLQAGASRAGHPFDETSMTEDYELALRLGQQGLRTAFIHLTAGPSASYIATEEHFPDSFLQAVRQKSRWLMGITLQGWDRLGWAGSWANRYMLLRDRKALLTAYLNAVAFVLATVFSCVWIWQQLDENAPRFFETLSRKNGLGALLGLNGYLLLHRLIVRACFVWRYHGWQQALLSIPRATVANAINFAAACRAITLYLRHRRRRTPLLWDKTAHRYPTQFAGQPGVSL